jgi:hypothetical protein
MGGERELSQDCTLVGSVAGHLLEPAALDAVVDELQQLERRAGIEKTLAIGRLVLTRFFGGNAAIWRDRRRNKSNSIRRLAEREGCPFSKSALNEAVAVYVASLGMPCVLSFGHITASHVASVLRLAPAEREEMLGQAERERWSVRQLKSEVIAMRRADGERRGRPILAAHQRVEALLRTCTEQLKQALDMVRMGAVSAASRAELQILMSELLATSTELQAGLEPRVSSTVGLRSSSWTEPDARAAG